MPRRPIEQADIDRVRKMKELLADPAHWTKGAFARNERGEPTPFWEEGSCFCLGGAWLKFDGPTFDPARSEAERLLFAMLPNQGYSLAGFNDHPATTHAAVMAYLNVLETAFVHTFEAQKLTQHPQNF
jgi:hypothetical protein